MALHIRTGVYEQTAQTQDPHYLPYHPHFFNIYFGFTSPQWPNILRQESMYKQQRPRLSRSTLFAIPIIFILCVYIIKMSLHIRTEVHAQTGHTQTCTIHHITHSRVITSSQWPFILGQKLYTLPEWPMCWDRSVCTIISIT